MIILKYSKTGSAKFISHIDILRHLVRTIRRMGVNVAFSKGYNPHMLLKLSAPCPIGIASAAEYLAADCSGIGAEEFLTLFNSLSLDGLKGLRAWEREENPNFQAIVKCADYFLPSDKVQDKNIREILDRKTFELEYEVKGKTVVKNVMPEIIDLIVNESGLTMRLALGNRNLRADRLLFKLNEIYNIDGLVTDIVKTEQYTSDEGEAVTFDQYLDRRI